MLFRSVPVGEHVERARQVAQLIAAQAPLGVQATLRNSRIAVDQGMAAAKADLIEALGQVLASKDAQEGVMSFIERREAVFRGE